MSKRVIRLRVSRLTLLLIAAAVYNRYLRPKMLAFGANPDECAMPLPGDEMIAVAGYQATRAVNIDAPPAQVFAWLAQMGRDNTGYYGLDSLSNQGNPSAAYLRQDLPVPSNETALDNGLKVVVYEPDRALVLAGYGLPSAIGQPREHSTAYVLTSRPEGGTRLVVRSRGYTLGKLGRLYDRFYEVLDFLDGRAQLENLKTRAEALSRLSRPVRA